MKTFAFSLAIALALAAGPSAAQNARDDVVIRWNDAAPAAAARSAPATPRQFRPQLPGAIATPPVSAAATEAANAAPFDATTVGVPREPLSGPVSGPVSGPIAAPRPVSPPASDVARAVFALLSRDLPIQPALLAETTGLRSFYGRRAYEPFWTDAMARELAAVLRDVPAHGLNPEAYDLIDIERILAMSDPALTAERDVLLSQAAARYARDITGGRVNPKELDAELHVFPSVVAPEVSLARIAAAGSPSAYLMRLAPQSQEYARLKTARADHVAIRDRGLWRIQVPAGGTLTIGDFGARVDALRGRLVELGDLVAGASGGAGFDRPVADAVRQFQTRHGLAVDGSVGPATLAALNVGIDQRIEQIDLNLERRRWMPEPLGERYVFVNMADFSLKVVSGDDTIYTTRVVIGDAYNRTPVFSDIMEYVEINPYWNVPSSIATKEFLPKLKRNPGYLSSRGYELLSGSGKVNPATVNWSAVKGRFPYRIRQKPGRQNALGRIKFMFPNQFAVYLHDTPSKSLFSRSQRAFSHGCIRVEDPFAFADVLLRDQGWPRERIEQAVRKAKNRTVRFDQPIPVHLVYLTAFVNKDGEVNFRDDIYGRDERLAAALADVRTAWR